MSHPAGKIGVPGTLAALRLGGRPHGVTIPEIMEAFGASKDSARRYVMRLVREGKLERTSQRRRRPEIYEKAPGAGGVVYRVTEEGTRWAGLQKPQGPRRSRARSR